MGCWDEWVLSERKSKEMVRLQGGCRCNRGSRRHNRKGEGVGIVEVG